MITKIISGGQTGVDRAALDVALEVGLPCGGWCPKGRKAEDGVIPERYPLLETASAVYPERTRRNVQDSEGTLILTNGPATGGTALTIEQAARYDKPCLILDLAEMPQPAAVRTWADTHNIGVLNVAGPRASEKPGIYAQAAQFLREALA
jgi:hypothetical protein